MFFNRFQNAIAWEIFLCFCPSIWLMIALFPMLNNEFWDLQNLHWKIVNSLFTFSNHELNAGSISKQSWKNVFFDIIFFSKIEAIGGFTHNFPKDPQSVTFFTFLWFATINYCNFYKLFYSWHLLLAIRYLTSKFPSLWQLIFTSLYSTLKRNKIRTFATFFLRQFPSIKWSYFHYSQHRIQTKIIDSGQPLWAPTKMSPKNYQEGFFYIHINF